MRKHFVFLGLSLVFSLVATAFGQIDAAGLKAYFSPLIDADAHAAALATHIENLGADAFNVRRAAQKALNETPFLPRGLLLKAKDSPDPEVRLRVDELLGSGDERRDRVGAALGSVAEQNVPGLAVPLLALAPHLEPDQARVWQRAFEATVEDQDEATLLTVIPAEKNVDQAGGLARPDFVRQAAIRVLGPRKSVEDASLKPLLSDLLKDPADVVALEAAQALLNREGREALTRLGELLQSDSFGTRWRAAGMLRGATGKNFDFAPDAEPEVRDKAIKQWATWLAANSATADLKLPVEAPRELTLFNGVDLENWVAVNGEGIDKKKADWSVKNGLIACVGNDNGHLRTREKFQNYQLDVTWRWPGGATGDSGVFLHLGGEDRTFGRNCIEAQLLAGKAGDFWMIGGFDCKVAGRKAGSYAPMQKEPSEKKAGEWNRMQAKVKDGVLEVLVNGVLQNEATDCPKTASYIALQSEGDAVEFGRVLLTPLD